MNENIAITLIQPDIAWEKVSENIIMYDRLLKNLSDKTDLIILPEMFTTGFSMNPVHMAEKSAETIGWMKKWAEKMNCVITGSIIDSEKGKFYNRLIWMRPDGSYSCYDKRHLFRKGDEHLHYNHGNSRLITKIGDWKICPLICYDLRFPVWSRNRFNNSQWDYDILIYVANWPAARSDIWQTLLLARAIENQAYVAGVNRVGEDHNNIFYNGNSLVAGLSGNIIEGCASGEEGCKTVILNRNELIVNREQLGVSRDWDLFNIIE